MSQLPRPASRLFLAVTLALVGVAALVGDLVLYGDWRSSHSALLNGSGNLKTSVPSGYAIGMVAVGSVCIMALVAAFAAWSSRRRGRALRR